MRKDKQLNVTVSETLLESIRAYAARHELKLNVVVKRAFYALQDSEAKKSSEEEPDFVLPD